MAHSLSWLIAFVCVACSPATTIVYVGSGGCDNTDTACKEGPADAENWIRAFEVDPDGSMSIPQLKWAAGHSINVGGQAAWLTRVPGNCSTFPCPKDSKRGCLIASVPSSSELVGGKSRIDSGGVNPVFAATTNGGRTLLVANYHGPDNANTSTGAGVASFSISDDCGLSLVSSLPHSGSSVDPHRQGGAHAHSIVPVRGSLAYSCDLGMDIIFAYEVDYNGKLTELHRTPVQPGSGPRHLVQHPSLPIVYVVHEMAQLVTTWQQEANGALTHLQTESVHIESFGPASGSKAAEIVISPSGSSVFVSNRGMQNTVSVFSVSAEGRLSPTTTVEAPAYPRGMTLTKDGKVLLVAGQSQTEVWSYSIDGGGNIRKVGELHDKDGMPAHPVTFALFEPVGPVGVASMLASSEAGLMV